MQHSASIWNNTPEAAGVRDEHISGFMQLQGFNAVLASSGYGFEFRTRTRRGVWSQWFYAERGAFLAADINFLEWRGDIWQYCIAPNWPGSAGTYNEHYERMYVTVVTSDNPAIIPPLPEKKLLICRFNLALIILPINADGLTWAIKAAAGALCSGSVVSELWRFKGQVGPFTTYYKTHALVASTVAATVPTVSTGMVEDVTGSVMINGMAGIEGWVQPFWFAA